MSCNIVSFLLPPPFFISNETFPDYLIYEAWLSLDLIQTIDILSLNMEISPHQYVIVHYKKANFFQSLQ